MKELSIEACIANIGTVTAFVEEALEAAGCPMKIMMQIDVAIDELFGNIARYAYAPRTGTAVVRVETDKAAREVSLTFEDSGVPFTNYGIALAMMNGILKRSLGVFPHLAEMAE